jgi:hypothetical protein
MSWSFQATGKPDAVLAKATAVLGSINIEQQPEQEIVRKCLQVIEAALPPMKNTSAVEVKANGSQWSNNGGPISNTVNLTINTIYGFVE